MGLGEIRLLVMDIDGVLTSGNILLGESGEVVKEFDVRDGTGIKYWQRVGKATAVISGRTSAATERRCAELGITRIHQGVRDKRDTLAQLLVQTGTRFEETAYIGDDLMDIPAIRMVGLGVAVAGSPREVCEAAKYVTRRPGGHGAVREVIEMILRYQGLWERVMERYEDSGRD